MPVERTHGSACLIDVLDRMQDKGLVITNSTDRPRPAEAGPQLRARRHQTDLTRVRLRVVVGGVRTYLDDEERIRTVREFGKSESNGTMRSRRVRED